VKFVKKNIGLDEIAPVEDREETHIISSLYQARGCLTHILGYELFPWFKNLL
jgi:hypothetical protein